MKFYGIDVGRTGAIGVVESGKYAGVEDLPIETYRNTAKGKERWQLDCWAFEKLAKRMQFCDTAIVMIEDVWPNSSNGSVPSFGLGQILGTIKGCFHYHFLKPSYVAPIRWKKALGLGKEKYESLAKARELFPEAPLHLKKHHNRAEALLIAYYAWKLGKDTCEVEARS